MQDEVLLASECAQVIHKSVDTVRRYERSGLLPAAFKTRGGVRLFLARDVEALRQRLVARATEQTEIAEVGA